MKYFILLLFLLSLTVSPCAQQDYTAYVFMAEECPVCNYLGKSLKKISNAYNDKVNFVAVFPQEMSNIKSASLFKRKYILEHFRIKMDPDQIITSKYNGTVTPEVVIVDVNDNILYQGRINTSYAAPGRIRHGKVKEDMDDAIQSILKGQRVPKPWPDPIGCYITKKNG